MKTLPKKIANFLSLFPDDVISNLTPEHRDDVQYKDFLHISRDSKMKDMIPRIADRQAKSEDRTTPRVVGAPTILGCIVGYQTILSDYFTLDKGDKKGDQWLGGYYIYKIPYEWRFRPTDKLVPDQKASDELWLLGYSEDSKVYRPSKVGKIFAVRIEQVFATETAGRSHDSRIVFFVEVSDPDGLELSAKIKFDKGYWKVSLPYGEGLTHESVIWNKDSKITVEPVSSGDYYSAKKLVADLLGFTDGTNAPYQF